MAGIKHTLPNTGKRGGKKDSEAEMEKVWSGEEEKDKCGGCKKIVKDDQNAIECEECKLWFHGLCEKVGEEEFRVLVKKGSKVMWQCANCRKNGRIMKRDNGRLMEENKRLKEENELMKERFKRLEEKLE